MEVEVMRAEAANIYAKDLPGKILKKDGTVRLIHGVHLEKEVFQRLVQHPKLVKPVMQMLGNSAVYVHRCSINFKAAFENTMWSWHQDYMYLWKDDGIPTARLVNAIVFLDEVNEFNGPILLIPGSHKEEPISLFSEEDQYPSIEEEQYLNSRRMKYIIDRETIVKFVEKYGIVAPKGTAGSVLFFHTNCVHGSAPNSMSPFNRTIATILYNSVENIPVAVENPRPEFLASRDYRPIELLSEDVLLQAV